MVRTSSRARRALRLLGLTTLVVAVVGVDAGAAHERGVPTVSSHAVRTYDTPVDRLAAGAVRVGAGSTVLLLVAADGPSGARQTVRAVEGCGSGWRLVRRANASSGTSEVWAAEGGARRSCTPVAVLGHGPHVGLAAAYVVPDGRVRSAADASGRRGAPAVTVPVGARSLVLGVGNDWARAESRRLLAGQRKLAELEASTDDTLWVQGARAARAGTLRFGTSSPRGGLWNLAAVEVVGPGAGVAPTPTPSVGTPTSRPSATRTARPVVTATPTATATPAPAATPTATPTATPSPSATAAPPPPAPVPPAGGGGTTPPVPAPAGRPGPATTGVPDGVVLQPSGPIVASTPGQVISGLDIAGPVVVRAPDVVITNCRIRGDGTGTGVMTSGGSVTISDSEISGFENGIGFDRWTARRVDVHSMTGDGVKLGSDVLLEDSWIHDLTPGKDAHADGGQMQDGVRNLVVRDNVIDVSGARTNAALFLAPDFGPSTEGPVTVQGNLLDGGGYTLFAVDGGDGRYVVGNITVTDNVFGRRAEYGAARVNVPVTWQRNVWEGTSSPVTP
ncbi:right-handed parallel beta-helix repeat-containing protein [Cellulomonas sp.]|uniref:right-handed parallel beta-helix repeat-containing protein n=1 Tax=Cellulomonas sp. TaxID=40001 RepID=UPI002811F0D7|nr:right-handed parallel beta-helix repeat-containing protein [Cellulomonas sp.]